jgi:hypothetical protein
MELDAAQVFLRHCLARSRRSAGIRDLVRASIDLGDEPEARAALAGLRTLADLVRTGPLLAAARFAQGAVAHAFADPVAARAALMDAVDLFGAADAAYERAQALLLLARCQAVAERPAAARTHTAEALHLARELSAWSLVHQAQDLLVELGTSPAPQAAPFAGLTRREAEILCLGRRVCPSGHAGRSCPGAGP